jgi:hypothetical protein
MNMLLKTVGLEKNAVIFNLNLTVRVSLSVSYRFFSSIRLAWKSGYLGAELLIGYFDGIGRSCVSDSVGSVFLPVRFQRVSARFDGRALNRDFSRLIRSPNIAGRTGRDESGIVD